MPFNRHDIAMKLLNIQSKGNCSEPVGLNVNDMVQAYQKAGFGIPDIKEEGKSHKKRKTVHASIEKMAVNKDITNDSPVADEGALQKNKDADADSCPSVAKISTPESENPGEGTRNNNDASNTPNKRKRSKKTREQEKSISVFIAEQGTPPQKDLTINEAYSPKIKKTVQWKAENEVKKFNKKVAIALPFTKVTVENKSPLKSALKKRELA